jgi:CrcB protein
MNDRPRNPELRVVAAAAGADSEESAATAARKAARRAMRDAMVLYGVVGLGAVIGGVLRALSSIGAAALLGTEFAWGTLFVNVLGSFFIGFYATITGPEGRIFAGTRLRQFVMTGFCGGFTTFSVFSLETVQFVQVGNLTAAALNVGVSVVAWLGAVWLGHRLASRINRLRG